MIDRRKPQPRAIVVGVIVSVAGLWGALVPFVGPTFGYGMGGTAAWTWSESHLTLHLLPGIAAVLGGVLLIRGRRATQVAGALIAALGGIWFVVAPTLRPLWAGRSMGGMDMGGSAASDALSGLGYHYGTGALIAVLAAYALGVLTAPRDVPVDVRSAEVRAGRETPSDSARVSTDA